MLAPRLDPTPIFEHFRGQYATEILTAAVAHFEVFGRLAKTPMPIESLARELAIALRPAHVLVTGLRAMGLLRRTPSGDLSPTDLAREHLLAGATFDVGDYIGLAASSPGVLGFVQCLRDNKPFSHAGGTAFIYRDGLESAMEQAESARHFTLALAGRAKNLAPIVAGLVDLAGAKLLVDVAGGTGLYSIALLQRFQGLHAVLVDRPEVLKIAREFAIEHGVLDRMTLQPGDMFADDLPGHADAVLLSNVLHDWDVPTCEALVAKCARSLRSGGRLLIHDVFLDDDLGGPLALALYSAALFTFTEGRAYSAAEYGAWMRGAGLTPGSIQPTLIHAGLLPGVKP